MQLLEKEKLLKEQESLKIQREKEQSNFSKPSVEDGGEKSSPLTSSSHIITNPISPLSLQQPVSNNPVSDMDSNSQFSPPAHPSSSSHQDSQNECEKQATAVVVNADLKRAQSIQEMREKERRRREEIAGKIDMTEQHKLIAQFEQNFAPPS